MAAMMERRDKLLLRLDDIGRSLARTDTALALIGLGSVGRELARLDDYSDLDFFVVVESQYKQQYIDDLSWLSAAHTLSYCFRNSADGYKFLFADGIYGEMAVFGLEEMATAVYSPGRIVWRREGVSEDLSMPKTWPPAGTGPSADYLLGEALTNLYVGLTRFRRGERLSAFRFIQGYAVDRIADLAQYMSGHETPGKDQFDSVRRFERRHPDLNAALPLLLPGYERTPEAAAAVLTLLDQHFALDPAITRAIRDELAELTQV
jgi:hypothetical protein